MRKTLLMLTFCSLFLVFDASAQFTGPSVSGRVSTVEQVHNSRPGSYVTVTGHIVSHLRGDYFTFRDETGDLRVEIESPVWQNREIGPNTPVRLMGEVDRGPAGRYLWVKSLTLVN